MKVACSFSGNVSLRGVRYPKLPLASTSVWNMLMEGAIAHLVYTGSPARRNECDSDEIEKVSDRHTV